MILLSAVDPTIKPFRRFQSIVASATSPTRYPYSPGQVRTTSVNRYFLPI